MAQVTYPGVYVRRFRVVCVHSRGKHIHCGVHRCRRKEVRWAAVKILFTEYQNRYGGFIRLFSEPCRLSIFQQWPTQCYIVRVAT
jgi:hypothetical protein